MYMIKLSRCPVVKYIIIGTGIEVHVQTGFSGVILFLFTHKRLHAADPVCPPVAGGVAGLNSQINYNDPVEKSGQCCFLLLFPDVPFFVKYPVTMTTTTISKKQKTTATGTSLFQRVKPPSTSASFFGSEVWRLLGCSGVSVVQVLEEFGSMTRRTIDDCLRLFNFGM